MFGKILNSVVNTVEDVVDDPIGFTSRQMMSPISDTIDIVQGLTEGELRLKATASLGADVVLGMGSGQLVEWFNNQ